MTTGQRHFSQRPLDDTQVIAALARIEAKLENLSEIVVGRDGDGGLRADLRALASLRDKGLGMVAAVAVLGAVLVLGLKAWIVSLFPGLAGRP